MRVIRNNEFMTWSSFNKIKFFIVYAKQKFHEIFSPSFFVRTKRIRFLFTFEDFILYI